MAPWEEYLKKIYFDPSHPASFSGPQKLYKVVKSDGKYDIGMHRIRKFLHNQEAYSLHKPVRRRFHRNHVVSAGIDDLWMADLIDMIKYEKWNDGTRYILLVIDTFSKYVWLRPLKQKTGLEVKTAFEDIFKEGRIPKRLITDKGQEFRAKVIQALMKKHNIIYSPTQNETKASTSERAVLTLKSRIMRYLTYTDDYTFLPVIEDIAGSYNGTFHRTIGMAPSDVNDTNQEEVQLATYFAQNKQSVKRYKKKLKRFKYKIGDYVRITHLRNVFTRAYDQTYSGEVFRVSKRYYRGNLCIYRLVDLHNKSILGSFYQSELLKVDYDPDANFKIEKILKTKGKGQNKQYLVKWKFYPQSFNSWIKALDID